MLTGKERMKLRRAKSEVFIYTNIKLSIKMTFQAFWMPFLISTILLVTDKNFSLPNLVILFMISIIAYLYIGRYLFKSLKLCFKLTAIYLKISVRKLVLFAFGK